MSVVAVVYDPDQFEGLDLNQAHIWLGSDGVQHPIAAMLITERLVAAAELERMGAAFECGLELVVGSLLYRSLLDLPERRVGESAAAEMAVVGVAR